MIRKTLTLAALALAPALASAAVTVKGSDTMVILAQRWAEEFMRRNPGQKVQVTGGGSGVGISSLINGTTDIASSSRPMKEPERQKLRDRYSTLGHETAVARDGLAVYVHESSPVSELTIEQLRSIYLGDVANWKQVGGPDAPIVLYSRENSSGTYVFFKDHVLKGQDFSARAQTLPGTAAVVNAVAKEKFGIGYGGAAYAKGVKEVKLRAAPGAPALAPTPEDVKTGRYPLSRDLYLYTRNRPSGDERAFIDFCLSPEGQAIVTKVGYYPVR
jgi:phosphate transport system substrate-binding protein